MKNVLIVLVAILMLSCQPEKRKEHLKGMMKEIMEEQKGECEKSKDGVFIHISHGYDDAHRVLMALNMAVMMSETQDVLVYIDIKGVEFLTKEAKNIKHDHFPDAHSQIKKLIEKGVTVMACPGCMKAAGITKDQLIEGVKVANKEAFFGFTKGRIVTLDY